MGWGCGEVRCVYFFGGPSLFLAQCWSIFAHLQVSIRPSSIRMPRIYETMYASRALTALAFLQGRVRDAALVEAMSQMTRMLRDAYPRCTCARAGKSSRKVRTLSQRCRRLERRVSELEAGEFQLDKNERDVSQRCGMCVQDSAIHANPCDQWPATCVISWLMMQQLSPGAASLAVGMASRRPYCV